MSSHDLTEGCMYTEEPGQKRARLAVDKRRRQLGWSKAKLARESGQHPDTISNFLNGESWPYPATLTQIAVALHWDGDDIDAIRRSARHVPAVRTEPAPEDPLSPEDVDAIMTAPFLRRWEKRVVVDLLRALRRDDEPGES